MIILKSFLIHVKIYFPSCKSLLSCMLKLFFPVIFTNLTKRAYQEILVVADSDRDKSQTDCKLGKKEIEFIVPGLV